MRGAVDALKAARDLMNSGGRHWIKGAEKRFVGNDHVPGEVSAFYGPDDEHPHAAFCSIGALREVNASNDALIALAESIDPDTMKDERAYYEGEYYYTDTDVESMMMNVAEEVIISFNDSDETTWEQVRAAFSRAIKGLK